jgi:hypothetical protein
MRWGRAIMCDGFAGATGVKELAGTEERLFISLDTHSKAVKCDRRGLNRTL